MTSGHVVKVSMTWPEYLAGVCRIDGRLTRLTLFEADVLLALLLSGPDKPTQACDLVETVWANPDRAPYTAENVIRATVCALQRRKIKIISRLQFGYRIPREARGRP